MNEPKNFGSLVLGYKGFFVRTNTGSLFPWQCRETKMFYKWEDVEPKIVIYEGIPWYK